jgi:hypothetical protein
MSLPARNKIELREYRSRPLPGSGWSLFESKTQTGPNEQTRSGHSPCCERQAEAQFDLLSATFNVRGLSLPDQTRVVARRHLDRLHVSLHRAVVSRLSRT